MHKFALKSPWEVRIMAEGGKKLAEIRDRLAMTVKPGIRTKDLDDLAEKLILKVGGQPSFAMVPGYKYATCININEEVVHAVPGSREIKDGDVVGIDVGIYFKGWHTDTAVTVLARNREKGYIAVEKFLETGRKGLRGAIGEARVGNRVADISKAMEKTIIKAGYSPVKALTGHGVGRELHEEPPVPCFTVGKSEYSPKLVKGMVLAIEIMYNAGGSDVMYKNTDGWTITTADGKISGLFEETVAVTKDGPVVLTKP